MPHLQIAASLAACFILSGFAAGHGNHDERVITYSEKIRLNPADLASRHELALAHVEGGAWEVALAELNAAEKLKQPDSKLDFSVTRAKALAAGGKFPEARQVLDAFLEKSPADAQGLIERSRVFDGLKLSAESLADFRKAMAALESPDSSLYLEFADKLAAQNHQAEAATVIQKAILEKGEITSLVVKALDLETATGQWDAALTRIEHLEKSAPSPEPWMARRATVLAQAGHKNEAREAWTTLRDRIAAMPNLQRGAPHFQAIFLQAEQALAP